MRGFFVTAATSERWTGSRERPIAACQRDVLDPAKGKR
jgi:hypothetical protein